MDKLTAYMGVGPIPTWSVIELEKGEKARVKYIGEKKEILCRR